MNNKQLDHSQHLAHLTKAKMYPLCFLAHDIDAPTNVGSLFRIADALGVERIYLSGRSPTPPNSKIRKTSRATEKFVAFRYEHDPLDIVSRLKSEGYTIISLELTTRSIDIRTLSLLSDQKVCLILGSENSGVCQALLDVSDITLHIPMMGHNSSMNIASACSIATYEIINRYLI